MSDDEMTDAQHYQSLADGAHQDWVRSEEENEAAIEMSDLQRNVDKLQKENKELQAWKEESLYYFPATDKKKAGADKRIKELEEALHSVCSRCSHLEPVLRALKAK